MTESLGAVSDSYIGRIDFEAEIVLLRDSDINLQIRFGTLKSLFRNT